MDNVLRIIGQLPNPVRRSIRFVLGGGAHQAHWTHALWAWHFAGGTKRLDRVAASLCHLVALKVGNVQGKTCMEFGSGHLLSEPLVLWLAGARRVVAVDYNPILRPSFARRAFLAADCEALRRSLSSIAPAELIDDRIRRLRSLPRWTLDHLAELGIEYRAPLDFSKAPPFCEEFDIIHSAAVLEHLPGQAVPAILASLQAAMRPGALALHDIHLEDHRDFRRDPFAFLGAETDWRPSASDSRGNRLRASDWVRAFGQAGAAAVDVLGELVRDDAPLPRALDAAFADYAEQDLCTASILLAVRAA
jgi:hypothetical protein